MIWLDPAQDYGALLQSPLWGSLVIHPPEASPA
jgi:hypothetical protein